MPAMHWKVKASVQRACASLPGGAALYERIQRTFGKLKRPDVARKLSFQRNLCTLMTQHGFRPRGATVVEVGTGWVPLDPIGFWMCGAARVVTLDLHRHLDERLLARALAWMSERPEEMIGLWKHLVPESELRERHATLVRLRDRPAEFLREAGIEYRAPWDATKIDLPEASVDAHFSYNVFEHVPPQVIVGILAEGRRVLKPGGVSVHYVDPSDHFSHFDRSITRINFLRFGAREWERIAGNDFAYHNRLRDRDYRTLFERAGLRPVFCRFDVEPRSLAALRDGFPLDPEWLGRDPEDLARHNLVYVAVPAAAGSASG